MPGVILKCTSLTRHNAVGFEKKIFSCLLYLQKELNNLQGQNHLFTNFIKTNLSIFIMAFSKLISLLTDDSAQKLKSKCHFFPCEYTQHIDFSMQTLLRTSNHKRSTVQYFKTILLQNQLLLYVKMSEKNCAIRVLAALWRHQNQRQIGRRLNFSNSRMNHKVVLYY